jgi:mannan endo-1,4-beta-mannosidase
VTGRLAPIALGALALALVLAAGAAAQDEARAAAPAASFVRVVGEHFERAGRPFRFLGANVAVMHGRAHRAALASTLDAVQADGLSVIRVWALGERDAAAPTWARDYAFRMGADVWVEESFVHLDHVLVEAAARNLSVVLVLANRWPDYGGIPQYLRWSGDAYDDHAPDGIARAELGTFFRSERARVLYLAHVDRVVGRINSVTGLAYRDDPTILSWELVNEISAERRDASALAELVSTTAHHVRALDPTHLISAGHIGYVSSAERRTWLEIMSLPEVDYADAHAYPTEHDRVRTTAELDAFIDDHAMLAHGILHKPLVMGEVGFPQGGRTLGRTRAQLFDHFLDRAYDAGVDGALAWIYAPSGDHPAGHAILVDEPDADSRRVRSVLRERARVASTTSTTRSWPSGQGAPLWDASHTLVGTRRVAHATDGRITIAPDQFAEARFEWVGAYDGGAIAHVYGGGHGWVTYRFRAPAALGSRLSLSVRASSELPGRGEGASAEDGSRVLVSIDDHALGAIEVPPDDGVGRQVALEVPIDGDLARVLAETRIHTLRFEIRDDDTAHGLCFYGAATGREPLDPVLAADLPGHVEIVFLP